MSILKKQNRMVVIFGSPNLHGNTRALLSAFTHHFESSDEWLISEFNAYELMVHPCTDCKICSKKEQCVFDDLNEFDRQLRQCDLLVWASPIYNSSFPSPVKAILDRTQRYFEARFSLKMRPPIKKHRKAVLLLTMGSDDEFGVKVTCYQLKRAFSVMNTELSGCAVWRSTDMGTKKRAEALISAQHLSQNLLLSETSSSVTT